MYVFDSFNQFVFWHCTGKFGYITVPIVLKALNSAITDVFEKKDLDFVFRIAGSFAHGGGLVLQKKNSVNKNPSAELPEGFLKEKSLFVFCVALVEFVNTSGGINQHIFSGVERMRHIRDFQLYKWILVTIFPLGGFFRSGC